MYRHSKHLPAAASILPLTLFVAMVYLYFWGSPTSHESAELLRILNFIFTTLISVFIATLAGRSFLVSSRPALLAICVAMIVWGATAFVAVVGDRVGNYNLTIHNLGVCASGQFHLTGALIAFRFGERFVRSSGTWLSCGIAVGFCVVDAIWMAAQNNWLPPFYIEGVGATRLRSVVLISSIGMLAVASALTGLRYRATGWVFLLWYAIGLCLIAVGALGLILQPIHGSWLGWTARATQYIGGIYMLIGAVMTIRETGGWHLSVEERLQRSEQALRSQAELIRNVNDNTAELIFMKDRHGRLTYANAATLRLLGMSDLPPATADQRVFFNLAEADAINANDRTAMETGRAIEVEEVFTGVDGRQRTFLSTKSPLRDNRGQIIGVIAVSRDITERAIEQEQLRRAKEDSEAASAKLHEADRRKDEFLAILAHELRNPLAPIRNAVHILKVVGPAIPELDWARDVIGRQVDQMTRLIDDLMDVSRISQGKIELRRERVELSEILQSAVEASRPLIEGCGQELVIEPLPPETYLEADLTRLSQVFCNLLNNAAKYSDPGGKIALSAKRQRREILISLQDTGIGIPPDLLPHIFEMFVQVDQSLEKSHGGLGIGLTLSRRLVDLHGGSIEALSDGLGHGSEFVVRLPIMIDHQEAAEPHMGEGQKTSQASSHRILVVDDNRDAADSLSMMLKLMGHDVRSAYDGEEALRIARDFRPRISLLDLGMLKLNGYDAARGLRQEEWGRDIFLVAVTGWGQAKDRSRSKEAGFDRHLVKPVSTEALLEVLSAVT